MDGLSNHRILVSRNVGTAGVAEVKDTIHVGTCFRASKVTGHETTEIFCERYAEITCALTRTPLHLILKRNLGP